MSKHTNRLLRLESITLEVMPDRDRIGYVNQITRHFTPTEREEIAGYMERHPAASPTAVITAGLEYHFTPAECDRIRAFRARLQESEVSPCVRI